ncbi:MAG: NAD-dependent epimerase/dehydratase family protein [Propionibacteriaceae bacterium]|nr:NAD-dependent epimerase/dehydratase family protein [Propionibacteriaceae bacterium]
MAKAGSWLITGAGGFLGNVLVRELLARGEHVRAGIRRNREALKGLECEQVVIDITKPETLPAAFEGLPHPITVVHCAGMVSIAGVVSPMLQKVNVEGTRNMLEAAKRAGAGTFIHISSVHAIPEKPGTMREVTHFDPEAVIGGYARTKAEATQLVLDGTGMRRIIIHPAGITGPGDFDDSHLTRLVRDLASGQLKVVVPGGYDFVDVRDVVSAIIEAQKRGRDGEPYIISGHYASVPEIAGVVSQLTGRRPPAVVPMWLAKTFAPLAEFSAKLRKAAPLFTSYSLHTLAAPSNFDHSKATRELGHRPRPLAESLADTVAWLKQDK